MPVPDEPILPCHHCGNRTRHSKVLSRNSTRFYAEYQGTEYHEPYICVAYTCGTCEGLAVFEDFSKGNDGNDELPSQRYPRGPSLLPPQHTVVGDPVPTAIAKVFRDGWHLRYTAPNAFANQVRRALEFVCNDQGAVGGDLYGRLEELAGRGVLPPGIAETAHFIRKVGNLGSHASHDLDHWDAELLDDLFRMVIEYVYVGPARVKRLQQRLGTLN